MRPSKSEQSRIRGPIRWQFLLVAFIVTACGSSSHSDDHDDGGHDPDADPDADHVHDSGGGGDASSTPDGSTADARVDGTRCGDGGLDARNDRCDRD